MSLRLCLLTPPPEFALAAKLLDAAADALLADRTELAASLVVASDLDEIREYVIRVVGKMSLEVHHTTKLPKSVPQVEQEKIRMPVRGKELEVFRRDGWRCRFCEAKVIDRTARNLLASTFSIESRWTSEEFQRHAALYAMAASLDHVVPHTRGGSNEDSNLVTACYCCQFGRGNLKLEEVELADPRERGPTEDRSWDGLSRLVDSRGATSSV